MILAEALVNEAMKITETVGLELVAPQEGANEFVHQHAKAHTLIYAFVMSASEQLLKLQVPDDFVVFKSLPQIRDDSIYQLRLRDDGT